MRTKFFCVFCLVFIIFFNSVEGIYCTSCSQSCENSCQASCPGGNYQYNCNQNGGYINVYCQCVTTGGGSTGGSTTGGGGGGDVDTGLIIFAVVTMMCVCGCFACVIISIYLCVQLLLTPAGLCLLIIGLSALNWVFGLISIAGGIKALWDTFVSDWSLNTIQIAQILIPIVIAALAHIPHELSMVLALLICLVFLGLQGFYFGKLFGATSIVPYVTGICTTIGVLAIIVTLALMVVIIIRIQKRLKERREQNNLAAIGLINEGSGVTQYSQTTYGLAQPFSPTGFGSDYVVNTYAPPPLQVYPPSEYGINDYATGYAPVPTQQAFEPENDNKEML